MRFVNTAALAYLTGTVRSDTAIGQVPRQSPPDRLSVRLIKHLLHSAESPLLFIRPSQSISFGYSDLPLSLSLSKIESLLADYNVLHCAHSLTGCWCQYPATSVFAQASKNQAWFISIVSRYNNGAPFYRTYIDLP